MKRPYCLELSEFSHLRGPYYAAMRMIGYVRVSTSEQSVSGLGLEDQRRAITAGGASKGWDLTWIDDPGYSAKDLNRPGIMHALEVLRRKEADGLVVSKIDRLSRSLVDFAGLIERSKKEGWALVALDLGVDTSTPQGEMLANVMMTFAQFERRLIGERTRAALAVLKTQGVRLGRPVALPAGVRARIGRWRAAGATAGGIAAALNASGTPTAHGGDQWHPSTVRAVLRSLALDGAMPPPFPSPAERAQAVSE